MTQEEKELLASLKEKEGKSKFEYEEDPDVDNVNIPDWIPDKVERPVQNLGNVNDPGYVPNAIREENTQKPKEEVEQMPRPSQESQKNNIGKVNIDPRMGMEAEWKNIPAEVLPSNGFGYPKGFELAIRSAKVSEIRHFSTVDESDRLDLDDKLNHMISKCMRIKWDGGVLDPMDLWYEDRFFVVMSIRDMTFIKGENRILLPLQKNCKSDKCSLPNEIELRSNFLDSFELDLDLIKRYNPEKYCFEFVPKDGSPGIDLYIPTIGVTTKCRRILKSKRNTEKKFDESFADVSTFIIPDWRNLDERTYDQYERSSADWTPLQFSIVDQMSKKINFATKSRIFTKCESCGGEAAASIRFPGGYRSLFIISDLSGKLL